MSSKVFLSRNPENWELEILHDVLEDLVEISWPKKDEKGYLDADIALITGKPDFLEKMEKLRFIQVLSAGVHKDVLELAWRKNIPVASSKGCNARAVAELVFAFIFALEKKIVFQDYKMKKGEWIPYTSETLLGDIEGKTMLILGFGNIGLEIAKIAEALGIKVVPVATKERFVGKWKVYSVKKLKEIVKIADYLVMTLPPPPPTRGLINNAVLCNMKETAFLINVGRGSVVDEEALYEALVNKKIAGAGIDVWWKYPPSPDAPSPKGIHKLDNVVATPHKGGWSKKAWKKCLQFSALNIKRFVQGLQPFNIIPPQKGY